MFNELAQHPTIRDSCEYWLVADHLAQLDSVNLTQRDIWACRWGNAHLVNHALCLCPTYYLVDNVGLDGTGENTSATEALRNYLKGRDGDRANAVLAAAGYNFGLLVRWFEALLRALIKALLKTSIATQTA